MNTPLWWTASGAGCACVRAVRAAGVSALHMALRYCNM